MGFWLTDPTSIKHAALFPTGGVGNFLNTLTLLIFGAIILIKTKFNNIMDNKKIYLYFGTLLVFITTIGLLFGNNDPDEDGAMYDFDLTYD